MNISYNTHNEAKRKILIVIKDNTLYKKKKYINEEKIKSYEAKTIYNIRKYLLKDKIEFIDKNRSDEINIFRNKKNISNKPNFQLKKNLSKNIIFIKLMHYFFNLLILFIKLFHLLCNKKKFFIKSSEISLKIKGSGNIKIISDDFFKIYNQCEINLNNTYEDLVTNKNYFNESDNINIKIKFNNIIENAMHMFQDCDSIIEIDFSNFDTSQITNMAYMFYNCKSLKSLDLSNFNTSLVQNMSNMFAGCSLLNPLNLINFDTLHVQNMSYMFANCSSINTLNVNNFNTLLVKNMDFMFYLCSNLISLNLSNFDTSSVTNLAGIFFSCSHLESIELSNFNTSKVTSMAHMFSGCSNLRSLDITNFDTSQVTDISFMFNKCKWLKELNLSSFDTSKVIKMSKMFYNCLRLTSLNLSNFKTSNVRLMQYMFSKCSLLNSLDLSNFDTSRVANISLMFSGCSNLCSLEISNFKTSKVLDMNHMFYGCFSLTSLNLTNFDTSNVQSMYNMFYNCSLLESLDLSNFNTASVIDMNQMFYNCSSLKKLNLSNFNTSNVSNLNRMFYGCQKLENINLNILNSKAKINDIFYLTHSNLIFCGQNDKDIYIDSNSFSNKIIYCNNYIKNSNSKKNYVCHMKNLSLNNETCNECGENYFIDNNTFININNNYSYINCISNEFNELSNTYDLISYMNISNSIYNIIYNSNTFNTINSLNINNTYYSSLDFVSEIYKNNSSFSSELIMDFAAYNTIEIENKTEIIQYIINNLINEFNMTELDGGEDKKIVEENKVIILTSTENQKNNEDKNNITMNLGECENILKKYYNISNNNSLYILQIILEEEGMKIPKIEYEVYYPLNDNNLTKLNLTLCKDTKIEISIKVKINGSLDKYNLKSDYYNDICSTTTSESGTDISLKDRKNEFIDNNMSLCEENCDLIEYNPKKEKAKCSCDIKLSIPENYDIKFNKKDFLKSFIDIKNIFNIKIIKCHRTVLKIKTLMKNYGFFIVGSLIILYSLTLFIFSIYSYDKIKKEVINIILALKINSNPNKKTKIIKKDNKNINGKKKNKKYIRNIHENYENKKIKKFNLIFKKEKKYGQDRKQTTQNNSDDLFKKMNPINNLISSKNNLNINIILRKKDFELNSLNYIETIKLDKRNYCEYYISLIKYNHPIIFSFIPLDDYNSYIIKLFLFFFSFCLDIAINALFFTDDTMHKIYEDKGKFDLLYQIPQILYSSLISRFIDTFIRILALSQDNIVELKQLNGEKNLKKIQNKLFRLFKIKFILFFITSLIILILFGYYIICFCGVYINTQIHLIKDSFISFIISLLIPFVLYLIPGIFRIPALRAIKSNRIILYKISQFIENLFC